MEAWWDLHLPGGLTPNREKYPNIVGGPQGESEWEFFEPVRPGDTIEAEHTMAGVTWHKAKPGPGKNYSWVLRVTGETTFTNQKGQLVGRNRSTGLSFFK